MVTRLKIFFSLLLMVLVTGCGQQTPQLIQGQPAPDFNLPGLDGNNTRLSELRGKVVAVRFWADWCPFCKEEMAALNPIYAQYETQGLVIVAVNVRQDRESAEAFIRSLKIRYPTLLDEQGEVARRYGVIGLPTTFFIDRQGTLRERVLGESTPEIFSQIALPLLQQDKSTP